MSENITINGRADKTKSAFRMEYTVGINIKAKPEKVWAIMTNARDFPRWNSTVKSMEGRIGLGETVKLVATIAPTRSFNLKVNEFVPEKRMVWGDEKTNPMFKGVRTYTLTPKSDGSTDFTMSEVYTGLMLPMIAGSLPDFRPTFEQYASDLKREAERK
jgi:uncharacterized protein YndB with AHSA1/START domain